MRLRVVAGLALNDRDEVLMGLRSPATKRPNLWEYIGGKVDGRETDAAALVREWQEEARVTPTVVRRLARAAFNLETPFQVSLYYVTLPVGAVPTVVLDPAGGPVEFQWVAPAVAVERLPMVPSCYTFYPMVMAFIAGGRRA